MPLAKVTWHCVLLKCTNSEISWTPNRSKTPPSPGDKRYRHVVTWLILYKSGEVPSSYYAYMYACTRQRYIVQDEAAGALDVTQGDVGFEWGNVEAA